MAFLLLRYYAAQQRDALVAVAVRWLLVLAAAALPAGTLAQACLQLFFLPVAVNDTVPHPCLSLQFLFLLALIIA